MGDVILAIVWLVIGGGLVWYFIAARRRKHRPGLSTRAEHERTIHESRAAGHARPDLRRGHDGGAH